jgi:hypothetical protein
LNPNQQTKPGCGAKVILETQAAIESAFSTLAKIAKIRRGGSNKIFNLP